MDLAPIILVAAALIVVTGAGRVLTTLGRASDCMASLFVPPNRSLGWPHGVQEQDAPWSWQAAAPSADGDLPAVAVATERLMPLIHGGTSIRQGPQPRR
jgi:hypothetical protein